ncbi:ABC transporter ATP-binding protein [Rhizobium sp. LjRoot98]|uniref:ABC transporter ATP-binding protein n=1 Tax=unclassified Rhizobium TaxID=2613769 RepID=UPI000713277A|nr:MULTISPECIES: ABC transporter ATP-binding protein [unclassified Rhizobium]KQV40386.1 ABC transporter [Rhizobium sp. Root1204]KQY02749.1 ABC transporter [Rhizobium sp. Root1334]KRB99355.1 ABC transporter [Rhizobium sp. Root73]
MTKYPKTAGETLVSIKDLRVTATTDSGRTIEILKGVSFNVRRGEVLALIGESGSGKTTIALSLLAYARAGCHFSGGRVLFDGVDLITLDEGARRKLRGNKVSYVPQSAAASFNPSKKIMDQVVEVAEIHGILDKASARDKAIGLFRSLSLPSPETIGDRYPHQVSGGQIQRLAAAMALLGDPELVVFDEPTTALDVTTQIEVLKAFKSAILDRGMTGVYVSHDLAVVAQISDRIIVLKDGEIQEAGKTEQIVGAPAHPYTQALISAFEPVEAKAAGSRLANGAVLEMRDVVAGYGNMKSDGKPHIIAVDGVSFALQRGHSLGVIGESGCGKSTLLRVAAGLLPAASGACVLDGKDLRPQVSARSKEELRKMQIVFQLADTALNPAQTVGNIIGRPLTFYHGMKGETRDKQVIELLDMVRMPAQFRHRLPRELSGGQRQRINLARALAAKPDVLLCDEITSALDTVVAAKVLELLKELQRELHLSYLFVSHDIHTVQSLCDEVMVMFGGKKLETFAAADLHAEARHPYTKLLASSLPTLDPGWLDNLKQDPELVRKFAHA